MTLEDSEVNELLLAQRRNIALYTTSFYPATNDRTAFGKSKLRPTRLNTGHKKRIAFQVSCIEQLK